MKKISLLLLLSFAINKSKAQELFVYTEPASNMAKGNIGVRVADMLMNNKLTGKYNNYVVPELMFGISKKVMLHTDVFFSDATNQLKAEGGSIYLKYRFFSIDDVHNHFRMAAFGRYSFNNGSIYNGAVNLYGMNSGYEGGVVATKLIHKVALSASGSWLHAMDNGQNKFSSNAADRNAIGYTLSLGKLMLPKKYISYNQTNMNVMLEMLGQTNVKTGYSFVDIAPSLQFIFNSKARIDVGYRCPVVKDLYRQSAQGFLVRLEYNFFNVY